jgi:quercetin dioxygenase-like cupin family protein
MFKIINKTDPQVLDSLSTELYQHRIYIGQHAVTESSRNSYWYVDNDTVVSKTGVDGLIINSSSMCVEIYGYTPETRTSTYSRGTDLPYINGCSTKQLITPVRPGDPTFQMLYIPKGVSEQEHHIHATARIVYVARGRGKSVVGTLGNSTVYDLNEGDIIVLGKMIPHHFETSDSDLLVLPLHIFSSIASEEFNHPMYNGTHRV